MRILAITPHFSDEESFFKQTEALLKEGIAMLQYRDKTRGYDKRKAIAERLKVLCDEYQIPLIINDDVSLAEELGVGVHLGQEDTPITEARKRLGERIIGATAHDVSEAKKAQEEGADYLGCGALYPTTTKENTSTLSLRELRSIVDKVTIPVYAIGGIKARHQGLISSTGVEGVALCSALYEEDEFHLFKPSMQGVPTVLTIAGSDCSGGAGIQADLKTFNALGCYGMSAITSLTAQHTQGVQSVHHPPTTFLKEQLDSVFADIFPMAVKIGMLGNEANIQVVLEALEAHEPPHVVLDPVMVSTSGSLLLEDDALRSLDDLLKKATLITPNIYEAEVLTGKIITNHQDMEEAAEHLLARGINAVLIKGGHLEHSADDLFMDGCKKRWFRSVRIDNPNTHGTGCTLSSAIASFLAQGYELEDAIRRAKAYLTSLLLEKADLGRGSGPLLHYKTGRTL